MGHARMLIGRGRCSTYVPSSIGDTRPHLPGFSMLAFFTYILFQSDSAAYHIIATVVRRFRIHVDLIPAH